MLVLSRKYEESVVVGGRDNFERLLEVTVLEIKGGSVMLGFEAGPDLAVHRREIWERIRADGPGLAAVGLSVPVGITSKQKAS